jgi:sec-independent protein translocase protein TatC
MLKQLKGKKGDKEMSFLEHLEELRWHIIRSVVAVIVLMVVAFSLRNIIFDVIILGPRNPDFITSRLLCQLGELVHSDVLCINQRPANLINITMAGQLTTHISVSLITGLILAFPVILWEFWKFFKPALKPNEIKYSKGAVLVSSLLFFTGVLFGYYMIAPLSIHFLTTYEVSTEVINQINIRSYISNVTSVCLATGIMFELPVVVFFLTKVGIVTPKFMRTYRRHAIVVIMIVSAIITPPDVFSLILVTIPLLFLYEISIIISKRVKKQQDRDNAAFMNDEISTDTSIVPS